MNKEAYMDPFFRYSYTFNKDTGEIEIPEIFLLDRRLHKIGRLYPVSDFNVVVSLNSYNEVSFHFSKYHNNKLNELYGKLKNNSVIFVQGLGCFEVKVNETDNKDGIVKSISGISLGESELSQILATIEINTGDDMLREGYERHFPTVLYRPYNDETYIDGLDWSEYGTISVTDKKKIVKESSLLHRLLTYAPHYQVGHVDESLWYVQREFSFTDQNINDILKAISEEIGCIFTFNTYLSDSGNVVRQINAYDVCYCKSCYEAITSGKSNFKSLSTGKYRSITNGVCDNCGKSESVYDFGEDTDIFLTTDNLTDEIQVQPEGEVKNCLKIVGGDDMITSTVQALNMSSSNKIMMFSEEQKEEMSANLKERIDEYDEEYSESQNIFENIVKTEYNVIDLIQYLQSGKMPLLEDDVRDIQQEVKHVLESIQNDYGCNFYISSYSEGESDYVRHAYNSSSVSIRNLFTLYLDKGYSVSIKNGDLPRGLSSDETTIKWNGTITIYETSDKNNNYADIHILKDGESFTDPDGVTYNNTYVEYGAISNKNSNSNLIEPYAKFHVNLCFGDIKIKEEGQEFNNFKNYIEQYCEAKLASQVDNFYKNRDEKDWKLYSYERLKSYYDGYESCLDSLNEIYHTGTDEEKGIITEIQNAYGDIQKKISDQMYVLENQLNALYELYGVYPDVSDSSYKDYIKQNYSYDLDGRKDYIPIIKDLSSSDSKRYIGSKPFACQVCGSSNIGIANKDGDPYNYCKNCDNHDQSKIMTYGDVAKEVVQYIDDNAVKGEKKLSLDYIQNNTYHAYLSPSREKYTIKESNGSNHQGYIITCGNNTVTPIYSGHSYCFPCNKTGKYIIENVSPYPLILETKYIDTNEVFQTMEIDPYSIEYCLIPSKIRDNMSIGVKIQTDFIKWGWGRLFNLYTLEDTFASVNYYPVNEVMNYNFRGKYIWCSEQTYRNIQVSYTSSSIDSIVTRRNDLLNHFSLKNYLGNELYTELMPHIREDKYENSNYTSDGCLTNSQLVEKAKELLNKAKHTLATSCMQQYSLTSTIYAIVATKYRNWFDDHEKSDDERVRIKIHDDYEKFKIGNWIRCRLDNKNYKGKEYDNDRYKLRLTSIQFSYDNIDNTTVEFSNVEKTTGNVISDIQSILSQASAISGSFDYVATQAEQGEVASKKVNNILQNGLDSALSAVKAGENQDIIMDRHGLLIRKYIPEIDAYSKYQTKIINRNIVMTEDNWDHAKLAIGLGTHTVDDKEQLFYGVWADVICGNLLAGKKLAIYGGGDGTTDNATVIIDGNGITLDGGAIKWVNKGVTDKLEVYYAEWPNGKTHPPENSSEWEKQFTGELNNNYLWSKTVITDTLGQKTVTYNCLGNSPDGIKLTKKQYYLSTSEITQTGGHWLDYQPTWVGSGYIWTRIYIEYISGSYDYTNLTYDEGLTKSLRDFTIFKDNIDKCLEKPIPTTEITENYVFSPKIGGGYLYITSSKYSVEIDPNHGAGKNTLENFLFCIREKNRRERIMSVDIDGEGYFKGQIIASEGNIGGWEIKEECLITQNGSSIYQFKSNKKDDPAMRIMDGKAIFGKYNSESSNHFDDQHGYSDISTDGIYVGCPNAVNGRIFVADTTNNKITIGSNMHIAPDRYLHSTSMIDNVPISIVGMSNSQNIYLGMYYYNNSHHPDYINSIILSALNTEVLGVLKTPDGTVVKSDARLKTDVESVNDNEIDFILGLSPKKYKLKEGTSGRYHYGFIAQDVEEVMKDTIGDAGLLVKSEIKPSDDPDYVPIDFNDDNTFKYGLRYEEFIAPMVKTIQMMDNEIKDLKREIELLQEKITEN